MLSIYFFPVIVGDQTDYVLPDHGFWLSESGEVTINNVNLVLENWVNPPLVSVSVECGYMSKSSYNVAIELPFVVKSGLASWPWTVTPQPTAWNYSADGIGSSVVSNTIPYNASANCGFATAFPVDRSYLFSSRGIETITIPLNFGPGQVFMNVSKKLGLNTPDLAPNVQVYIVLPTPVGDVQAFPTPVSRGPLLGSLTKNTAVDSITWGPIGRETVTVSYVDERKASEYNSLLILGSLVLGAGIPAAADFVGEEVNQYRKSHDSAEHTG